MKNDDFGVNISGVFNGVEGLNEATRLNALAIEKAKIKSVLNPLDNHSLLLLSNENPYPINLIHVNYHKFADFLFKTPLSYFSGKYNIGVWAWEMSIPPTHSQNYLNILDELWVPSNFCVETFAKASSKPIIKFAHPIHFLENNISRKELKLPENKFIFLNVFNALSSYERKNPFAIIKAFNLAFGKENDQVILIIKALHLNIHKDKKAQLIHQISENNNIILIEAEFEKNYQSALFKNCDAYISLHRSEGFGLTMAEAMYYGKPTIATGYSGNLDFMNVSNSFLVDFDLIEDKDGFLLKGGLWADPKIEDAAIKMREVYFKRKFSNEVGEKGALYIHQNLSLEAIGSQMKNRLEIIYENFIKNENKNSSFNIKLTNENYILQKRITSLEKSIPNRIIDGANFLLRKFLL